MITNYLELQQAEQAIKLAEDVLMRPLTDDEKEMIIVRGFNALMESLEVSHEDWRMLEEVKKVLAAYTSGDDELFMTTLPQCPLAKELFEFILAAYDAADDIQDELQQVQECGEELPDECGVGHYSACGEPQQNGMDMCTNPYGDKVSYDPVEEVVQRMASGETVQLDDKTLNAVCSHLANNFMNYIFKSINGESSLKVEQ